MTQIEYMQKIVKKLFDYMIIDGLEHPAEDTLMEFYLSSFLDAQGGVMEIFNDFYMF